MSDQEIVAKAETPVETLTLFDELAGLVPEERQAEYYRVIAHTRTLSPNDEMLRILEAMGVLALLTRETPGEIATEKCWRRFWKPRQLKLAQSRSEWSSTHRALNLGLHSCRRNWKQG